MFEVRSEERKRMGEGREKREERQTIRSEMKTKEKVKWGLEGREGTKRKQKLGTKKKLKKNIYLFIYLFNWLKWKKKE